MAVTPNGIYRQFVHHLGFIWKDIWILPVPLALLDHFPILLELIPSNPIPSVTFFTLSYIWTQYLYLLEPGTKPEGMRPFL